MKQIFIFLIAIFAIDQLHAQNTVHFKYKSLRGEHSFFIYNTNIFRQKKTTELHYHNLVHDGNFDSMDISFDRPNLITTMSINSGRPIAYFLIIQPGDSVVFTETVDGVYDLDGNHCDEVTFFQELERLNLGIFLKIPEGENFQNLDTCRINYLRRLEVLESKNVRPLYRQIAKVNIQRFYLYRLLQSSSYLKEGSGSLPIRFQQDLDSLWLEIFDDPKLSLDFISDFYATFYPLMLSHKYLFNKDTGEFDFEELGLLIHENEKISSLNKDILMFHLFGRKIARRTVTGADVFLFEKWCTSALLREYALDEYYKQF